MIRSHFFCCCFFKCLNATIPLTCALANEYPSSNEISKKNGTVRGDCIACDALLDLDSLFKEITFQILCIRKKFTYPSRYPPPPPPPNQPTEKNNSLMHHTLDICSV